MFRREPKSGAYRDAERKSGLSVRGYAKYEQSDYGHGDHGNAGVAHTHGPTLERASARLPSGFHCCEDERPV